MKRLIKKAEEVQEIQDPFLGQYVEVVRNTSKYLGYRGYVDEKMNKDKYRILLTPGNWEVNQKSPHQIYIKQSDIYKWIRILPPDLKEG